MKSKKLMAMTIQIEEAAITALSIYFLTKYSLGLSPWIWAVLFFSPDLSMLGYLVNTRVGAFMYNLVHHRAIAIALIAAGLVTGMAPLTASGLLLLAHSSFDRMLGYGLKFGDDFKHTNLGWMGKAKG